MTSSRHSFLFGTLGALSAAVAGGAAAAPDTSQWKCESCPFEQGTSGSVEAGIGGVSQASPRFGDFTGLDFKGAYAILGGEVRYRGEDGTFGNLRVTPDLFLDSRSISVDGGREGLFSLRLGYDELPRYFTESALTPYLGVGGAVLTLPPGYPALNTGAMPLDSTLQSADLSYKRSRLNLGGTLLTDGGWSFSIDARRVKREGTQAKSGAFYSTAEQLVAPLDQTTDEVNALASYAGKDWQLTLAYFGSFFSNADAALTWTNPFTTGSTIGATTAQFALAPDNQFQQLRASVGYNFNPQVRATADLALGRATQNAPFLAATLNSSLPVASLPAGSLQGEASTLNANVALTAAVTDQWRLSAVLSRDERDNKTPIVTVPWVSTDMFVAQPRSNQAYSFTQDRFKLSGDYRGSDGLKVALGAQFDSRERSAQAVETTRESTIYTRIAAQPMEELSLALKLAYGERSNSGYGTSAWTDPAENPLMRKYNLADRSQGAAGLRADIAVSEGVSLGLDVDGAIDNYSSSSIGLTDGWRWGIGADLSLALSEATRLQFFARGDWIRSQQAGSESFGNPNWTGENRDSAMVVGLGLKHAAIPDKLDIGADLSYSGSSNTVLMNTQASNSAFPDVTTSRSTFKLYATYRLKENLSLTGSYWYEHFTSDNWQLQGVQPATIWNYLAFGIQPPQYNVNVFRVTLRYSF